MPITRRGLVQLGAGAAVLAEPVAPRAATSLKPAACQDNTPHKVRFVTVAPGVALEVLDWGGSGPAMVLLAGLGDNAHVFDQFAFQFTDYFHVIGITRRGFLPSSQPEEGYDVESRVADDIAVLNALGIGRAVFVGHSIAGSELAKLGETHKDRVESLVFLDALDLAERFAPSRLEPPGTGSLYTEATTRSLFLYQAAEARFQGARRPDAAVCLGLRFDADGSIAESTTPDWVNQKILAGVAGTANPPVDWAKIDAPRLGIFAPFTIGAKLPWYWYLSSAERARFDKAWPSIVAWSDATISTFAHANPVRPLLLPGAPHYLFISNVAEVVRAMRGFLSLPLGAG